MGLFPILLNSLPFGPKLFSMKRIVTLLAILLLFLSAGKIAAQTTITCDSVLQTSTCAGGNVIIPFSITGTFPFGNVFTAELSDNWGNFGSPVSLGTTMFTIGGNGIIFGAIPANANFGFLYRVRIVSSNPQDTSNNSPNTLIVSQIAQLNTILANPGDSACPGDTITLFAVNPANSYTWSTGDTTASIQVTTSGIYSVTTVDFLLCESTTSDTITFDPSLCTGIAENHLGNETSLYPNPASGILNLSFGQVYAGTAQIHLYNSQGSLCLSRSIRIGRESSMQFDVSRYPAGLYYFVIESDGQRAVKKLVIE